MGKKKKGLGECTFHEKELLQKALEQGDTSELSKELKKIYQELKRDKKPVSQSIVHNPYAVAGRTPF